MQLILVIIGLSFITIILGKLNWKSDTAKYTVIAIIALSQTLYLLYKMIGMKFPFNQ